MFASHVTVCNVCQRVNWELA